jgi:hypothetical protein
MRILGCLGFLLAAATAANAQTYTTVVDRVAKTVTTTAPNGTTATTRQVARTASGATYTTTINRSGSSQGSNYQPMGASGYKPMGDYRPMGR